MKAIFTRGDGDWVGLPLTEERGVAWLRTAWLGLMVDRGDGSGCSVHIDVGGTREIIETTATADDIIEALDQVTTW